MNTRLALLLGLAIACGQSAAMAEPVPLVEDYQVLQRGADDRASCFVALPANADTTSNYRVEIQDPQGRLIRGVDARPKKQAQSAPSITIDPLEVGGPYSITVSLKDAPAKFSKRFERILVGDIWLLGGQSNMFGIDLIKEELAALPYLNMFNVMHIETTGHWCAGVPPIHRIPEPFAEFVIKGQHPDYPDQRVKKIIADKEPVGGIDCSYFFARKLYAESRVPIGLIPCAIGGAMAIWSPKERDSNRYGFAYRHIKSTGGKLKGVLFFQGEQDAIFGDEQKTVTKPSLIAPITTYGEQFAEFVEALRKDFQNPDMPVIFAQICRHHNGSVDRARGWEIVREAQRRIPQRLPHSHCVPSLDLDVMDGIHLDYNSLRRVGERMAFLALPYAMKGVAPRSEITLESVKDGGTLKPTIVVEFRGVTGKLQAPGRPLGFTLKRKETGEVLDWIYKTEFDPVRRNVAILRVTSLPKQDVVLYYGAGAAPYVNIVDDNDMPVPAFGPVEVR